MARKALKKEEVTENEEIQGAVAREMENIAITVSDEKESNEVVNNAEDVSENADIETMHADLVNPDTVNKEKEPCSFQEDIQEENREVEEKQKEERIVFRSTSEELRSIIRAIVEDSEFYSKKELVRILTEKASSGFTDACLINVLRNMVADGSLMQLERGSYMKGNGSFKSRLHKYLLATRTGIKKACTLNASEMEEADFEIIRQIKAVECDLDILVETLEKLGA